MGGSTAGGLGGAALGTLIAPGVGTAVGATLGGLAGSGIDQLGGGGGGVTNQQPQAGQLQVYQPQNQPAFDQAFQNLLNPMISQAQAGIASQGGISPAQQLYPQVSGIAQGQATQDVVPGSYGAYGGSALQGALDANRAYAGLFSTPDNLLNYGQQAGSYGRQALPTVYDAFTNPQIGSTVQNILNNPYYNQQIWGAQTGADIGAGTVAGIPGQVNTLRDLGTLAPGWGKQAAQTTQGQIPLLQQLASAQAGRGAELSGLAQGLMPQLQTLYGQTVPGLLEAGGRFAEEARLTNPLMGQIQQMGMGLSGQAPGLAQGAQATTPLLQGIQGMGTSLAGQAPGLAQQARADVAPLQGVQEQLLTSGMDPQGALFDRLTQQTRDQANAMNAMSGLAGTPYAAGLTNDAMRNFNIDWQNQQLTRQLQAAQGASGVAGQQLAGTTAAGDLLRGLTTAGGALGLSGAQQQLANQQAQADILNRLTTGGANIGLGGAAQQLANTLGGGQIYGNLVQGAGTLGGNLVNNQLGTLTGAGNLFNQGAQGAGALGLDVGALSGQGLSQLLQGAQGAQGLYRGALGLGAGGAELASTAAALPANAYQQQQKQGLDALAQQNAITGQGVQNLGNLTNQLNTAGQMPITGLDAYARFAGLPYAAAQGQANNALSALQNQYNFGSRINTDANSVLNNIANYLKLGQAASATGGDLALRDQLATASQLQGIGALSTGAANLLGGGSGGGGTGGGGGGLLFGSRGLGGALGINPQTGLLGSLFGGSTSPASDFANIGSNTFLPVDQFGNIPGTAIMNAGLG